EGRGSEADGPRGKFLVGEPVTNALPDFEAVLVAAFRSLGCFDEPQRSCQCPICRCAPLALIEMDVDVFAAAALVVVMEDQIFFGVVLHDSPRSGSSADRSFRTARKTLCLVA